MQFKKKAQKDMFKKGLQDFGFFCNMYHAIIKVV